MHVVHVEVANNMHQNKWPYTDAIFVAQLMEAAQRMIASLQRKKKSMVTPKTIVK